MSGIEELFKIDWLDEWKRMMCRDMFKHNDKDTCFRDSIEFPCKDCRYFVVKEK